MGALNMANVRYLAGGLAVVAHTSRAGRRRRIA